MNLLKKFDYQLICSSNPLKVQFVFTFIFKGLILMFKGSLWITFEFRLTLFSADMLRSPRLKTHEFYVFSLTWYEKVWREGERHQVSTSCRDLSWILVSFMFDSDVTLVWRSLTLLKFSVRWVWVGLVSKIYATCVLVNLFL